MTVGELKKLLEDLPDDSPIFYPGGDYKDDWRSLNSVVFNIHYNWTVGKNNYVIVS